MVIFTKHETNYDQEGENYSLSFFFLCYTEKSWHTYKVISHLMKERNGQGLQKVSALFLIKKRVKKKRAETFWRTLVKTMIVYDNRNITLTFCAVVGSGRTVVISKVLAPAANRLWPIQRDIVIRLALAFTDFTRQVNGARLRKLLKIGLMLFVPKRQVTALNHRKIKHSWFSTIKVIGLSEPFIPT